MSRKVIVIGRQACKLVFGIVSVPIILWSIASVFYFAGWSDPAPKLAAGALVLVCLTVTLAVRRWWVVGAVALASVLLVRGLYSLYPPSNDRHWLEENQHAPNVSFDGHLAHIKNLRHISYDDDDVRHVRWYDNTYDMREVREIDYIVEPFSDFDGVAHTLISFGFSNGQHLAISGEIRREVDESFSFDKAFFRHYELYFAAGDERDLIGLRTNRGSNPVYLIPIKTTEENAYAILKSMLEMLTRVATRPEYYNALTNSCTSNIICHIEASTEIEIPKIDSRRVVPAYSWEIAYEVGIVDLECPKHEVLAECLINGHAEFLSDEIDDPFGILWSRKIRGKPIGSKASSAREVNAIDALLGEMEKTSYTVARRLPDAIDATAVRMRMEVYELEEPFVLMRDDIARIEPPEGEEPAPGEPRFVILGVFSGGEMEVLRRGGIKKHLGKPSYVEERRVIPGGKFQPLFASGAGPKGWEESFLRALVEGDDASISVNLALKSSAGSAPVGMEITVWTGQWVMVAGSVTGDSHRVVFLKLESADPR